MSKFLLLILLLLFPFCSMAQAPSVIWQKNFGGEDTDYASDVILTSHGNILVCGTTFSKNIYINIKKGKFADFFVFNIDTNAGMNWSKVYGGAQSSLSSRVYEVDSGFYIAGQVYGGGKDVTHFDSVVDFWSLKTNYYGDILWNRTYGGSSFDNYRAGLPTRDGGYIYGGMTSSSDGDIKSYPGIVDGWIVKTDSAGVIEWQRFLSDTSKKHLPQNLYPRTWLNDVEEAQDNSIVVAGAVVDSFDTNAMIVKLDKNGNLIWQWYLGGDSLEALNDVKPAHDGGYIWVGETRSSNGDVDTNRGDYDIWVVKTDSAGQLEWSKTYGGSLEDKSNEIIPCIEGGYLIIGSTLSIDGMVQVNHSLLGTHDMWVVKIDDTGKVLWQKCLGGTDEDYGSTGLQLPDARFILVGSSRSVNGDATTNFGNGDIWVVKLGNPAASIKQERKEWGVTIAPNPAHESLTVRMDKPLKGTIQLLDMKGRVVREQAISSQKETMNTLTIPIGTYTLVLHSGSAWQAMKVVVQH